HHHADVQGQHERPREGRHAQQRHRHGRRGAGHAGVRRRGGRRRLRRGRIRHGQEGQGPAAREAFEGSRVMAADLMETVLRGNGGSVVEALEAGLSAYKGRALVNSITAEDERMEQILPLVKKYDAAVIALPNDSDEIPMESEKRLVLTRKIFKVATTEYGIAAADIL